jgi:RimJ/RimL family protein N-acetyltransferase
MLTLLPNPLRASSTQRATLVMYPIVSTADRPELAAITARWRWEAFFRGGQHSFEDILSGAQQTAEQGPSMPRTFVLLADNEPIGTASLAAYDLEERPDLTPWLAGVYVVPQVRGQGHAARLIAAVENHSAALGMPVLWLYTNSAERIYARAGWKTVETVQHNGKPFALMRRDLRDPAPALFHPP